MSFEQLIQQEPCIKQTLYVGKLISAKVLEIDKNYILVDANLKSEHRIPIQEFLDEKGEKEVDVGSEVILAVEALERGDGNTQLSRETAKRRAAWDHLNDLCEHGKTVKGTLQGVEGSRNRGGFRVNLGILEAFLPGSLIESQYVENGKELEFKILKVDLERNNIVLSHRAFIDSTENSQANRELLLSQLKPEQIVKGRVKHITAFGAFINLGGVDGLLHKRSIVWRKIDHPSEVLSLSKGPEDTIEVMVQKIEIKGDETRISLNLKELATENPWNTFAEKYQKGMLLKKRKILRISKDFCIVEIEEGIEGILHASEMDWAHRNPDTHTFLSQVQDSEGRIDVVILNIDLSRRFERVVSLSIKQLTENPWKAFAKEHQPGDSIQGTIRSVTDLGLFVNLESGIDGLVHHSELSKNTAQKNSMRDFRKGQTVEVTILSIDSLKERVGLSLQRGSYSNDSVQIDTNDSSLQKTEISEEVETPILEENSLAEETQTAAVDEIVPNQQSTLDEPEESFETLADVENTEMPDVLMDNATDVQEDEVEVQKIERQDQENT